MKELPSEEEEIPFRIKTYKKKGIGLYVQSEHYTPLRHTHIHQMD